MASYFLDTSALVKRRVDEVGHRWVRSLVNRRAGHTIAIAEVALVEVVASLCRMAREQPPRLAIADRDGLIARLRVHTQRRYQVVAVNEALVLRAGALCRTHPLRAYDAVQLACALTFRDDELAAGKPAPTFVCADTQLLAVASAAGLPVENPNSHP
jgi:uncharacterized protein